ncbi:hypothetical protein OIU35_31530 [Boseaceae bacterium BT-24-1]|nr:hypothetical protein [Boseaceae bacterium BT-24-1]
MGYTYDTYRAALAVEMVTSVDDVNFVAILPTIIDYAEQRIYRELDLLSTVTSDGSGALSIGSRDFTFPQHFVTSQQVNVITPAATAPASGTRNPLTPVTKEYLDNVWPSAAGAALPTVFAMITDQTIIVGPWPDAAYRVEVVGTIRPAALSESNTNTFLTDYLPDLFLAASMVSASGYMRNWGSQADDPKMAVSWESQYGALKASADVENMRSKYASSAWSSMSPKPLASPPQA